MKMFDEENMMKELYADFIKALEDYSPVEGLRESPVEGVYSAKYSHTAGYSKRPWRASLAIIAQGRKEVVLENEIFCCDAAHYTATPIPLPVVSRVAQASPDKPFLGILIELEPDIINEVARQIEDASGEESSSPVRAIYSGKANRKMLAAATRLTKLFRAETEESHFLAPLIIKELFYYLLKGKEGAAIRQYVQADSKMQKISQAVYSLKTELDKEINIAELSKTAQMSRSAFFKYFKEVTALSPIQFQKRLRLLEAKRLMLETGETAERSGYHVGYKSASQFSREYSRMFGSAPALDAKKSREDL
ncbi:MAG: AraC family transcriptional regulator [Acidobacteriota bacterium]